jgi:hypothetical protein
MNYLRHAGRAKVTDVVSEILGVPEAKVTEHWDGRTDVTVRPQTVAIGVDEIEGVLGLHPNDLRRLIYDDARRRGMGHEEALAKLFRDGKVVA